MKYASFTGAGATIKDPSRTRETGGKRGSEARNKADEEALTERDTLYHSFFDFAPDPMAVTDPDTGTIIDVNQALLEWSGCSRDQLLGRTTTELGYWPDPERRNTVLGRLRKTGFLNDVEIESKKGSGEVRQVSFSGKLIQRGDKKFLLSIARDITGRKRMEGVLKESERRLSDIIEFLPDATFVIDGEGKVIAWNRAMEEMSGVSKKDIIGQGNHAYAIPFYGQRREMLINMVDRNHANPRAGYEYLRRSGDRLYAENFTEALHGGKGACLWGTAAPLLDAHGNSVGAIESIRDVTDNKRAQEKLRHSYDELRTLSAHIQEVVETERAGISRELHDVLGQILAVINMDLRWLNKKIPTQEKELHARVSSALTLIKRATSTVQRVSSGLRPVVLDDFGLAAAIDHAVKEFRDQTGIDTTFTIDKVLDIDKESGLALYRIFQEALTNVMRHAKATKLDVSLRKGADTIQLIVKDNGRGISDREMSDKGSLGILGMRERASFIGGHLDISGPKGAGTLITVDLPLKNTRQEK